MASGLKSLQPGIRNDSSAILGRRAGRVVCHETVMTPGHMVVLPSKGIG